MLLRRLGVLPVRFWQVVGIARAPELLGESPVDDDSIAESAEQDVARLQVAMDDAGPVRVGDRLGDGDDPREERQRFSDIIIPSDDGVRVIDFDRFHEIELLPGERK